MTTLTYNDNYAIGELITALQDVAVPTGHTASLRLYDNAGIHYATIEKDVDGEVLLNLSPMRDIQDAPTDNGWKPGMD